MSRSGYCEAGELENWTHIRWRGAVASAIRGRKGQAFLRELLVALDAMPVKELISEELVTPGGEVCAIGAVIKARGIDASNLHVDCYQTIAETLGINAKIVQEIEWENDEFGVWRVGDNIAARRWEYMRNWVASLIKEEVKP